MMKGGLAGLMKQAQAMQENMKKAQEQLAQTEVDGVSGAGMVKVVMSMNDAVRRCEALSQDKMSGFASGLNLPPGFMLPF